MGAVYAICGEYEIPNRKGMGFSLLRVGEDGGKHGSLFDPATGACIEGKCAGQGLEPVAVCVLDGDVCVTGVKLAEEG